METNKQDDLNFAAASFVQVGKNVSVHGSDCWLIINCGHLHLHEQRRKYIFKQF